MRNSGLNRQRHAAPGARGAASGTVAILRRAGMTFAICLLVASLMPQALAAAALKAILLWAAIATGAVAALRREPLDPPRLTRWDEALVLILLGLLAGLFGEPGMLRAASPA